MSSDSSNPRDAPPSPRARRSSFVDMFSNRGALSPPNGNANGQPRRLSITTLGLSTLPNSQSSPFSAIRARAESTSSANSNSVDESPFEDDAAGPPPPTGTSGSPSSVPQSPFARRMSLGAARVMGGSVGTSWDGRNGNEGFDFAANLKARAERTSISGPPPVMPMQQAHQRSKSVVEPPKPEIRKQQKVPDHFQERILKGDFYMD